MSEVVGTLKVCVVLDGFIDREVTVSLSTVDGTAIGIIYFYVVFNHKFFDGYICNKFVEVLMFVKPLLYFFMVKPQTFFP